MKRALFACSLATALAHAELPDIHTIAPDLTVPAMADDVPAAGRRVRQMTTGWEKTAVYHALYLPVDWSVEKDWPVIVEWPGNGGYKNALGDECSGLPEGCKLGYGVTGGAGAIWVCAPFLNAAGTGIAEKWWGDPPDYDVAPTLAYVRAMVREVCARFGGDASRVVLAGFSRGSLAVNRLGLHDDETAKLWRAFLCYSQHDGVRTWPYPGSDPASALVRLERLHGRPEFICGEGTNADDTREFLRTAGLLPGAFTIVPTGFRNHNDAWVLRPSEAREKLRAWFRKAVK
jgi:hypothetical protein